MTHEKTKKVKKVTPKKEVPPTPDMLDILHCDPASGVDPYGFTRSDDFDSATYELFMSQYLSVLARRASRWEELLQNKQLTRDRTLKRYIRKGIPNEHRPRVWMFTSGADACMKKEPTLYQELINTKLDPETMDCISKDIPRTFPENIYFADQKEDPNCRLLPLTNVLVALAHRHPDIGYCQGLNFIAGLLLLIVKDEHKVFWLMDALLQNMLPDYYTRTMMGIKTDQEVLAELIKLKVPEVDKLFEREQITWPLISSKWFICMYADVLPVETTLRVWDCVFNEGSKVIFRVAVTMVKMNKSMLLACRNFPEIINVCKGLPQQSLAVHAHTFIESIFSEPGSFSQDLITKLRATCRQRVQ